MGERELSGESVEDGWIVRDRVDRGDSISHTVVRTVAAATDTSLEELPPLYRSIDTDALDELVTPRRNGSARSMVTVEFEYENSDVIVDGETVEVRVVE
jgi:hypothetical protein